MGIIMFLIAVVVEIMFGVFCIITKSNQQRLRNIIRIIAFTSFVIFSILSVIDWSLRYYTLVALLLLLAIKGAVGLINKKQEKRQYKKVRTVMKAIGMTVLILLATLPSIIFPQYVPIKPTGSYQIETAAYTYTDPDRIETYTDTKKSRKLNVEMWYPKNAEGTYPLIVFSHGALGIRTSNKTFFNELASWGYIVCSIDHTFQCLYTADENGHVTLVNNSYLKELTAENAKADKQQSYEYYQKWMKIRTDDINFVIDYILGQSKSPAPDKVYALVDVTKIGVMGHSLGGSSALGIGRMRKDVGAAIALESPFLCDIKGVKNNKFDFEGEKYPIPVLNVYSDSSWEHLGDWPQYAENHALLTTAYPTAFNAHITGAGHFTLTDLALTSPFLTRIFNGQKSTATTEYCLKVINKVCREFFDCYLKGGRQFISDGTY